LASAAEIAEAITRASGGRHVVSGRAIRHFADRASVPWIGPTDDRRYFMPIELQAHPLVADALCQLAPANGVWAGALVAQRIPDRLSAEIDAGAVVADIDAVLAEVAVDEQARHFIQAATTVPVSQGEGRSVLLQVQLAIRSLVDDQATAASRE
jgi:hypothetical protein